MRGHELIVTFGLLASQFGAEFRFEQICAYAVGAPQRVVSWLEHQWQNHARYLEYQNHVHPTPIVGALGLPQGDPFSPICLALLLSLPNRAVKPAVPERKLSGTLTYYPQPGALRAASSPKGAGGGRNSESSKDSAWKDPGA